MPPKVIVTFVSFTSVNAEGVTLGICDVVAKVPLVGKVTFVAPVIVNVLANAPNVVKFPPRVKVLVPLLTPVPPLEGDNCPVHPRVNDTDCNKDVEGVPPSVRVILESSFLVNADGVNGLPNWAAKSPNVIPASSPIP